MVAYCFGAVEGNLGKTKASPKWREIWLKNVRSKFIWPFAGDAAEYVGPLKDHVISKICGTAADELESLAGMQMNLEKMAPYDPEIDRSHLIAHSWATVILFEILFGGYGNLLHIRIVLGRAIASFWPARRIVFSRLAAFNLAGAAHVFGRLIISGILMANH